MREPGSLHDSTMIELVSPLVHGRPPRQVGTAPDSGRRSNRTAVVRIAMVVGVISTLVFTATSGVILLTPSGIAKELPGSSAGAKVLLGNHELELATESLRNGNGPAAGVPELCASIGTDSARCSSGFVSSNIISSPGSYVWSNLTSAVNAGPSGRIAPALAWDPSDGYILFYGGETGSVIALGDTWTYSNGVWTNVTAAVSGAPPALAGSGLAYDPASGNIVLFGGVDVGGRDTNYTWAYHAKTWTNLTSTAGTPPSGRVLVGLSTDSTDHQLVLFGGRTQTGAWQRDTWTFNTTWKNVTSLQPFAMPYIFTPILTDDPAGHGAFLTGPMIWGSASYEPGTFVFSAGAWQNLTSSLPTEPVGFIYGAGAYLPSISGVVAFSSVFVNKSGSELIATETWEFSNGAWTNVTNLVGASPDAVGGLAPGVAVDPLDQSILRFGGENPIVTSEFSGTTWTLSAPPKVSATASKYIADAGLAVSFLGTIANGLSPNSAKWSFGDGTLASGLSGSHAYAHAGIYTANFTATDFLDRNSTTSLTIFVNPAPSVSFALAPANPVAGSAVGFVPALTGGTAPFSYSWVFGDGSTSTAPAPSHTYSGSGSFTAKLTVTDAQGANATASLPVSVASAPSTAVSLTSGTGLFLLLGILLLLVIVVVLAILLARKPREPRAAPTAYMVSSPPPSPSPSAPAPYDEGPPAPPPPGAA